MLVRGLADRERDLDADRRRAGPFSRRLLTREWLLLRDALLERLRGVRLRLLLGVRLRCFLSFSCFLGFARSYL
jgi:hypothetical protein